MFSTADGLFAIMRKIGMNVVPVAHTLEFL